MVRSTYFETGKSKAEPEPGIALLGDTVRNRRERLGLTQGDVSKYFNGPSPATLRAIENAQTDSFRAKTLALLDAALAWPKGASKTLLTGSARMEVFNYLAEFDGPSWRNHRVDLNELLRHLVRRVDDEDAEKFDLKLQGIADPFSSVEHQETSEREFRKDGESTPTLSEAVSSIQQAAENTHPARAIQKIAENNQPGNLYARVAASLPGLLPDELNKIIDLASSLANVYQYLEGPLQQHVNERLQAGMTQTEAMDQLTREMYPSNDDSQDKEDQE